MPREEVIDQLLAGDWISAAEVSASEDPDVAAALQHFYGRSEEELSENAERVLRAIEHQHMMD